MILFLVMKCRLVFCRKCVLKLCWCSWVGKYFLVWVGLFSSLMFFGVFELSLL